MSVRKNVVKLGVAAVAISGSALTVMAPAGAATTDPWFNTANSGVATGTSIPSGSIIGAGSDTIQFLDGALAQAYNTSKGLTAGTSAGAVVSLAACQEPASGQSILTSCTQGSNFPETFPTAGNTVGLAGSSGSGANLLNNGGVTNKDVAFARASGIQQTNALDNYPFAVDELVGVVSNNVPSNAPATITRAELAGIYSGIYTNWDQLGGKNAPIHAYFIANSSSGTYQYFGKQLETEEGLSTSDNGIAAYHTSGTVGANNSFVASTDLTGKNIIEHDPTAIENDPDAIGAMSYSRVVLSAKQNGGSATDLSKSVIKPLGGFIANRPMYTVLRDATKTPAAALSGVNPDWIANSGSGANNIVNTLFGPSGYFCSSAAKPTIEAQGFFQLDSSTCGIAVTADPSNLKANDMPTITTMSETLTSSSTAGQSTVAATIAAKNPVSGAPVPTGSVTFNFIPVAVPGTHAVAGGSITVPLVNGAVPTTKVPSSIKSGTYQVAAAYSGDSNYQGTYTDADLTSGSTPTPATITVVSATTNPGGGTTTTPPATHPTQPSGPSAALVKAEHKLTKDQKALKKAKKQAKKAHGAKKAKLAKKIKKLKKHIKADKKAVKAAK